jgi:CubicO group peptidase (beta-lactamase class C family)
VAVSRSCSLLLTDALKRPFPDLLRETVLGPIGMNDSAYEQPLSGERDKRAARAHNRNGAVRDAKWHVYPELAAAGLWTTAWASRLSPTVTGSDLEDHLEDRDRSRHFVAACDEEARTAAEELD